MTDQMTPDEMRREANRLRLVADLNGARGWENNAESCRRGADALDRLAYVLDLADDVTSYRSSHVGTHYEDCYRRHAGCLAARIRATADPRVESRESATTPACAVCHTTGYWVGWLPKAGEYRCINHNKTKEEPHAG